MRWDIRIATHYFAAATTLAICVMAAPLAFHLEGVVAFITFWVSLAATLGFATAGFVTSFRGEDTRLAKGRRRRMIALYGMALFGFAFIGCAAVAFWPASQVDQAAVSAAARAASELQEQQNRKLAKIRRARRWIALADEILSDPAAGSSHMDHTSLGPDVDPQIRQRLWAEESRRLVQQFTDNNERAVRRFSGRLQEARLEMGQEGIVINSSDHLLSDDLVNAFSWRAWAAKLAGEGRHILTEMGEEP